MSPRRSSARLKLVWLAAVPVAAVALPLPAHAATPPGAVSTLDGAGAEAAPSKVDALVQRQVAVLARGGAAARGFAGTDGRTDGGDDGRVVVSRDPRLTVLVHAGGDLGAGRQAQLQRAGATVLAARPVDGLARVRVRYDDVAAVAKLPWVVAIRPSLGAAVDAGPVETEGVALHRTAPANRAGLTGAGEKVGAISDGVTSIAQSQAAGELPAGVQVLDAGDGDEGTAMLEIVHDEAPGAGLAFRTGGEDLLSYVQAFHDLADAGSTIITEDLAFDDEPVFQQGLGASTAQGIAAAGIPVSSSAGNLGARHAPRVKAVGTGSTPDGVAGTYANCGGATPGNAVELRPGTKDTTYDVSVAPGRYVLGTLQWSEPRAIAPTPGAGGFTDLNLYALDATATDCLPAGDGLTASTSVQRDGQGDSIEQVLYINTTTTAQRVKLAVSVDGTSPGAAPPVLDLRWRGGTSVDAPERAGSLNPDSNYLRYATSAAAADAGQSTDPAAVPLEPYSAGGPVQIFTTTHCPGDAPGPCTGVPGQGLRQALAPTWTAADGVRVSGAGGFPDPTACPVTAPPGECRFFGTSAAAPSAAGVMAIGRQALRVVAPKPPTLAVDALLAALAVDRGPAGPDGAWGFGVLQASPDALQAKARSAAARG